MNKNFLNYLTGQLLVETPQWIKKQSTKELEDYLKNHSVKRELETAIKRELDLRKSGRTPYQKIDRRVKYELSWGTNKEDVVKGGEKVKAILKDYEKFSPEIKKMINFGSIVDIHKHGRKPNSTEELRGKDVLVFKSGKPIAFVSNGAVKSLDSSVPKDISLVKLKSMSDDFHAIFKGEKFRKFKSSLAQDTPVLWRSLRDVPITDKEKQEALKRKWGHKLSSSQEKLNQVKKVHEELKKEMVQLWEKSFDSLFDSFINKKRTGWDNYDTSLSNLIKFSRDFDKEGEKIEGKWKEHLKIAKAAIESREPNNWD